MLGCNYSSLRAIKDSGGSFIILSTEEFHPLGDYLVTKKPFTILILFQKEVRK